MSLKSGIVSGLAKIIFEYLSDHFLCIKHPFEEIGHHGPFFGSPAAQAICDNNNKLTINIFITPPIKN